MLILASASPRRQDLLRAAGIDFEVVPAHIDESPLPAELPRAYAERLAREKALAVLLHRPEAFVLGADTIVVVDDVILGKPADISDAVHMLHMLSGRTHEVVTGVCLAGATDGKHLFDVRSETTRVAMCQLSDEEIQNYVSTDEPMDKAGAYAIQGMASRWIPRIEGDYTNVVGLPVALVFRMLRAHGAL